MNYAAIKLADCANGTGCRTVLFVSGCTHHCKGCFQPETWNFSYGKPYTAETENYILQTLEPFYVDGLTLLGGEPMEPVNQEALLSLIKKVHGMGKNIWIYSGYKYDELTDPENHRCHGPYTEMILSLADVLVDGEFHQDEKDVTLKFRGSANQRVIDLKKTREEGTIVQMYQE